MTIEFVVGFVVVLVVLSVVAEPIAARLRFPHSTFLVLLAAPLAYFVTIGLGVDTGLRAGSFHDLIFYVFLPVLVFDAAFKIPLDELRSNIGLILFLAIGGMLLTTLLSAAFLYWGIGHAAGFPWIAALLAGALLAPTDPVAVSAQLKTLGAPERLGVLIEGESLFNDATAIVLFSIFLSLALMPAQEVTLTGAALEFLVTFFGGAGVGCLVGLVGAFVFRFSSDGVVDTAATVAVAYGSFLAAEGVLHVSGVMASLAAGLVLSAAGESRRDTSVDFFWSALAYLANGSVFLLMGVTITISMFSERWLAMLIAIAAVLFARSLVTFGGLTVFNWASAEPLPLKQQTVLVWGGLRGAVTLALALALPVELDYWWTIQSMAFGVVLFTLVVQAPTMPILLRKTGVSSR